MPTNRLRVWFNAVTTYDVFPEFSAKVRRFVYNPLGVLVIAGLIALLCGLFLHPQGFVLAGGVLVVVSLGVLWPWLSLHGLNGTLSFDRQRATEGEAVTVRLVLRNHLPWAAWGLAVKQGFAEPTDTAVAAIASVPGRRVVSCRWTFVPARRGSYPLIPPRLVTGFPFGLWETGRSLAVSEPLIVWPRTYPVGPVPVASGERQVEGNVSRNKVGTSGDVLGVRPYRRGDSPRRIHWAQTARHDRLIVCELQSTARPVIQLVLDADPRVHTADGPESSREWAVRVVASLGRGWLQDGAQVGLVADGIDLPPASGDRQTRLLLDALAGLADEARRPLDELLATPACQSFHDGLQVIVTTDRREPPSSSGRHLCCERRWVILRTDGFGPQAEAATPPAGSEAIRQPQPWLDIPSASELPELLRGGWREARHGS